VHRAGHIVVEEVGESSHAVAGVEEPLQIAEVTLQRLQTFEGEHAAGDGLAVGPVGHEPLDVGGRADVRSVPSESCSASPSFSAWYSARSRREVHVRDGWSWANVSSVILSLSALFESQSQSAGKNVRRSVGHARDRAESRWSSAIVRPARRVPSRA
jgi:hypothetical protein